MKNYFLLTNPLCKYLDKPREEFTKQDLLKIIKEKEIDRITFHYTALDGKLKELKIPIPTLLDADIVLTEGERADGSSLFKGLIDTGVSDVYLVPVYKSAFLNPFSWGSLDFICRYLNSNGEPASFTPDNILIKAMNLLKLNTGFDIWALGELEFYLFYKSERELYFPKKQMAYHSSEPFSKTGGILSEMVRYITEITGSVKYAHNEVGYIKNIKSDLNELNGLTGEQLEIELLPTPIDETADNIVVAKWIIRNVAYKYGMIATFTPKPSIGDAGNGMHIHMKLMKEGINYMVNNEGNLSVYARRLIGGLCKYADSLTAFGNTVCSSYLRLVPDQEAPTRVCWSNSNRSAMIRVPLGWAKLNNLASKVNSLNSTEKIEIPSMQTVELRTPDGSANSHLLLAGITLAAEWGLSNDKSLEITDKLYIKGNIFKDEKLLANLPKLPPTCVDSAELLLKNKKFYIRDGIFPESIIEYCANNLKTEGDREMHKKLSKYKGKEKEKYLRKIIHKDLHKN